MSEMTKPTRPHRPNCPALLAWDIPGACNCDRPPAPLMSGEPRMTSLPAGDREP